MTSGMDIVTIIIGVNSFSDDSTFLSTWKKAFISLELHTEHGKPFASSFLSTQRKI